MVVSETTARSGQDQITFMRGEFPEPSSSLGSAPRSSSISTLATSEFKHAPYKQDEYDKSCSFADVFNMPVFGSHFIWRAPGMMSWKLMTLESPT